MMGDGMTMPVRRTEAGFSIIELMVALVAGLIVSGAVLAFTMSSLQSNSNYVLATRLTQELRSTMDFISRDLRRAGFDEASMGYVARVEGTETFSPFSPILIANEDDDDGCVIYAYDREPGNPGVVDLANGEIRGMRRIEAVVNGRTVGVIEAAESSDGVTPACDDASADYTAYPPACVGGWCALSDPRMIDVTSFVIDTDASEDFSGSGALSPMRIRVLDLTLTGSLVADPDVARGLQTRIRVRADCLRATLAECNAAPTGT